MLSKGTELDWRESPFWMLVYPWTLRPGLQVLATASHYWPLDAVDGIHELWDQIGNRPGYVNGSNIRMSKHKLIIYMYSHGNVPPKCCFFWFLSAWSWAVFSSVFQFSHSHNAFYMCHCVLGFCVVRCQIYYWNCRTKIFLLSNWLYDLTCCIHSSIP